MTYLQTADLKVLLVEDDGELVRALRRLFEVVGWSVESSSSLASARRRLASSRFDVVVLDIKLPDGEGHSLLPSIVRHRPRPGVIVLSGSFEAEHALTMLGHCDAFVPKPVPGLLLQKLVREVATLDRSRRPHSPLREFAAHHDLSTKETEVLRIALAGGGHREACEELGCKPTSISTYWKRIFDKTRCRSQREVLGALLQFSVARDDGVT
jgi:DNA-binding NarL/FixJ family response regulator